MNFQQSPIPGSVVRVRSTRYAGLLYHWGIIEEPDPFTGETRITHSEKGKSVRTTSRAAFEEGGTMEVRWVPRTWQDQQTTLHNMRGLIGQPYDLFKANCEHVVSLALTGEARSPQLAFGMIVAALGVGIAWAASRSA